MAKLSSKERRQLDDDDFGIPEKRMYPLHDKEHVESAVKLFSHCPDEYKPILARRILIKAKEYGMDSSGWTQVNTWAKKEDSVHDTIGDAESKKSKQIYNLKKATTKDIDFIYEMELMTVSDRTKKEYPNVPEFLRSDAEESWKHTWLIWLKDNPRVNVGIYQAYEIDDGEWWFIAEIALKPEFRGKGIGTSIITDEMNKHDKIVLYVDMYNTRAMKLYERLGFKKVSKEQNRYIMRWEKDSTVQESYEHTDMSTDFGTKYTDQEHAQRIVEKVHKHVVDLAKPPTGNQNCLLCTWSAEAMFRTGKISSDSRYLPRPVYSPRDSIFELKDLGLSIIKGTKHKMRFKSKSYLMTTITSLSNGKPSRWYVHVNWKDSVGGHEFMLMHSGRSIYLVDAQAGLCTDINSKRALKYFEDINFDNSFTIRLDDKKFDFELFNKMNDPTMTLPWDPNKDIPYMREHGMLGEDEDEGDMREHYDDLSIFDDKKESPVQESTTYTAFDEMREKMKTFEFGIKHNGRIIKDLTPKFYMDNWRLLSADEFEQIGVGVCDDWVEWEGSYLDKHRIKYKKFHVSFHKAFDESDPGKDAETHSFCIAIIGNKYYYIEGSSGLVAKKINYIKEFDSLDNAIDFACNNIHHRSTHNNRIIIDYTNVRGLVGLGPYEYNEKLFEDGKRVTNFTQESYELIQEGTTYRDKHFRKLYFHVSGDEHLDGQVFKPRVPSYIEPGDTADTSTEFEDATIPRVCFSPTIEGAMNAIICKINPQHPVPYKRLAVYIPEKPFNDYKHKTNKEIIKEKLVFDASSTGEVWIMEPVRMKLFGIIEIDSYKRAKLVSNVKNNKGERSQKRYYIFKWHWLVNPKIFDDKKRPKYDANSVITNLCYDLPKFRYGLIKDGRLDTNASDSDYDKYWVVHTGEEVDQAGGGNCYDMVEYEAGYLEAYGIPCKKYFIAMKYKNKYRTHTFIVVENNGKYVYIEGAFKRVIDEIGYSKEFDNLNDIFDYVLECSCEYDNVPEFAYGIFDYTDDTPTPGTSIQKFGKYITDNGKLIREGTFKFKKKEE